ncbi:hypothetical protein JQ596_05345 [Bradyrhizobium manausense]|uniref:hypothetical protein n=1 Tax=Bradyrhizobium TaxID=374 RepID=UPI001BA8FB75|nr:MULTISPECIES: hypothetical protein [Bradyrhizobium]MBR0824951.1 hypothetical protein [Bradyrhizobium manausense]UVO29283.1 hypothetical protein KUF59_00430 [Bradyrhizobium arachidis]
MRKILLIAALVLASASAQAAGPRSLSLASNEPAATPPTTTNMTVAQSTDAAKPAETPAYVERPSAVSTPAPAAAPTTNSAPATTQTQAATTTTAQPITQTPTKTTAKASKPKHKAYWTEGRIISELHRHGIYW